MARHDHLDTGSFSSPGRHAVKHWASQGDSLTPCNQNRVTFRGVHAGHARFRALAGCSKLHFAWRSGVFFLGNLEFPTRLVCKDQSQPCTRMSLTAEHCIEWEGCVTQAFYDNVFMTFVHKDMQDVLTIAWGWILALRGHLCAML